MHLEFSLPAQFLAYLLSEPSANSRWKMQLR